MPTAGVAEKMQKRKVETEFTLGETKPDVTLQQPITLPGNQTSWSL